MDFVQFDVPRGPFHTLRCGDEGGGRGGEWGRHPRPPAGTPMGEQ